MDKLSVGVEWVAVFNRQCISLSLRICGAADLLAWAACSLPPLALYLYIKQILQTSLVNSTLIQTHSQNFSLLGEVGHTPQGVFDSNPSDDLFEHEPHRNNGHN